MSSKRAGRSAANINSDDSKFTGEFLEAMSPRSKEAVEALGVGLDELQVKSFEAFQKPGLPTEIQKLRYQDFEQQRKELVDMVRNHYQTMMQTRWNTRELEKLTSVKSPLSRRSMGSRKSSSASLGKSSSGTLDPDRILRLEQIRMQRILQRQNKELESMMKHEIQIQEMVSKQEAKAQYRREKEEVEKRKRIKEREKEILQRQEWEKKKVIIAQKQREERRIAANKLWQQEQRFQAEVRRREKERIIAARARATARYERRLALERESKVKAAERERSLATKAKRMAEREALRLVALQTRKEEMILKSRKKKEIAKKRLAAVHQSKDREIEARRLQLASKMRENEERLRKQNAIQREMEQERRRRKREKVERMSEARKDFAVEEEKRIQYIRLKNKQFAANKRKLEKEKEMALRFKAEMARLNKARKLKNVERKRRAAEYERRQLEAKCKATEERTRQLQEQKHQLMRQRQRNQIRAQMQKNALVQSFAKLRLTKNWKGLATQQQNRKFLPAAVGKGSTAKGMQ